MYAIRSYYEFATDLMIQKFDIPEKFAGIIPSILPIGAIILTPVFGGIYDKKGKGASIMVLGAVSYNFV